MSISPVSGSGLSSARALARSQARAHSRVVAALRWLLPTLIVALLGLLAAFVVAQALRDAAARPKETPTQIRMISPHFIGRDDQGREYNLTARLAVRDDADMQRVLLTDPVMVLHTAAARPRTLSADHGVYDETTRLLRLKGHVRADDAANATLGSSEALVDTRAGTVTGVAPLTGSGARGAIEGASYTATEKNEVVVMHGGVHAVLRGQ